MKIQEKLEKEKEKIMINFKYLNLSLKKVGFGTKIKYFMFPKSQDFQNLKYFFKLFFIYIQIGL